MLDLEGVEWKRFDNPPKLGAWLYRIEKKPVCLIGKGVGHDPGSPHRRTGGSRRPDRVIFRKRLLILNSKLKHALMQDLLTGKKKVTPDPEDFDGEQ